MIGLPEARKKLQHATTSTRFYWKGHNSRERLTPNRSKSIQELEKVKTCNRCGALGHWRDGCPQKGHCRRSSPSDRSSGSGRFRKQSSSRTRSPKGKGKGRGRGRRVKFEEALRSQEVYRGEPEETTSHMKVFLVWALLDCGAAKSLAGAETAAKLAQACDKRGRKAGDDRK